jgi:hypothetical protein
MTYKEFREAANGVSEWQVYLIDNSDNHWRYGDEAISSEFDDKKVISFDLTTTYAHDIICTVDLI